MEMQNCLVFFYGITNIFISIYTEKLHLSQYSQNVLRYEISWKELHEWLLTFPRKVECLTGQ